VRNHPNGARGISALKIAVRDLDTSIGRYRALLGEPLQIQRSAFPDHGVSFASFSIGATTLTLLTPSGGANGAALAAQVENRLALRGEGAFGIVLHGAGSAAPRLLPLDLTHGVDLELLSASDALA
jgi:catechol 2,3-dioxygenase-like lactoylglutathione lyase family enzyme